MEKSAPLTQTQFRQNTIALLLLFTPENVGVSRLSLFQAVAIFDKYLTNLCNRDAGKCFYQDEVLTVGLACLKMATKFLGDSCPKI